MILGLVIAALGELGASTWVLWSLGILTFLVLPTTVGIALDGDTEGAPLLALLLVIMAGLGLFASNQVSRSSDAEESARRDHFRLIKAGVKELEADTRVETLKVQDLRSRLGSIETSVEEVDEGLFDLEEWFSSQDFEGEEFEKMSEIVELRDQLHFLKRDFRTAYDSPEFKEYLEKHGLELGGPHPTSRCFRCGGDDSQRHKLIIVRPDDGKTGWLDREASWICPNCFEPDIRANRRF